MSAREIVTQYDGRVDLWLDGRVFRVPPEVKAQYQSLTCLVASLAAMNVRYRAQLAERQTEISA
jgi:hypothetical protein